MPAAPGIRVWGRPETATASRGRTRPLFGSSAGSAPRSARSPIVRYARPDAQGSCGARRARLHRADLLRHAEVGLELMPELAEFLGREWAQRDASVIIEARGEQLPLGRRQERPQMRLVLVPTAIRALV